MLAGGSPKATSCCLLTLTWSYLQMPHAVFWNTSGRGLTLWVCSVLMTIHPLLRPFYSQFRNLLHHYVHQTSSQEAQTFWAGFGAIRRNALKSSGGFDEQIEGIEDVELGTRLASGGAKLCLDKSLQVKHLKKWTLTSSVKTDIFKRAVPSVAAAAGSKKHPTRSQPDLWFTTERRTGCGVNSDHWPAKPCLSISAVGARFRCCSRRLF